MGKEIEAIAIDGLFGYHRDMKTHAVINTNSAEYEAYMKRKAILESAKAESEADKEKIKTMSKDIDELKRLVEQLLNKDSNGSSFTSK